MLISFSVENWMCFKEQVKFDMLNDDLLVNPITAIYGENGKEKTALFKAFELIQNLIVFDILKSEDIQYSDKNSFIKFILEFRFDNDNKSPYFIEYHLLIDPESQKIWSEILKQKKYNIDYYGKSNKKDVEVTHKYYEYENGYPFHRTSYLPISYNPIYPHCSIKLLRSRRAGFNFTTGSYEDEIKEHYGYYNDDNKPHSIIYEFYNYIKNICFISNKNNFVNLSPSYKPDKVISFFYHKLNDLLNSLNFKNTKILLEPMFTILNDIVIFNDTSFKHSFLSSKDKMLHLWDSIKYESQKFNLLNTEKENETLNLIIFYLFPFLYHIYEKDNLEQRIFIIDNLEKLIPFAFFQLIFKEFLKTSSQLIFTTNDTQYSIYQQKDIKE